MSHHFRLFRRHTYTAVLAVIATRVATPSAVADDWDNGSGDARWSKSVNWSDNTEPTSGESALFLAGFPQSATLIRLGAGENAYLVGFGDNYTLGNFPTFLDSATLTLASGVVHASAGKSAHISVRLNSSNGLTKIGAGAVGLNRTTTIAGVVAVDDGTLSIRGALSCNAGAIAEDVGATAVVTVEGAGARWTISGSWLAGSLYWGEGNGTLNITNGGRVENSYTVLGDPSGGTATVNVSGTGSLWSTANGVDMIGANCVLNITGGAVTLGEDIDGGTGSSTLTLDGGTLDLANGQIGAGRPITQVNFRSGTLRDVAQINGGAGLTKTTTGTLILEGTNAYTGDTTVSAGTLKLAADGSFASSSVISLASGATLNVADVTGGSNFNGASFALATGQTLVGSGTIVGPIGVGAASSITLGAAESLTLSNNADIDAGTVSVEGGSLWAPNIINNGLLSITSGAINTPGVLCAGNDGTLAGGSGTGNVLISGGSVSAGAVLLGSAVGGSGDLAISGTGELTTNKLAGNDVIVDGGTVTVLDEPGDGSDPVLDGSMVGGYLRDGAFYVNAGTITAPKLKLGVTPGMIGTYVQSGGTLQAGSIYVGSSAGGIGAFRWSGGTFVTQSLEMTGPATLGVTLAGTTLGSAYAQLQISGHTTLAGTLEITRTGGFEPQLDDAFTVMTFGSRSGTFESVTGRSAGPGKIFRVLYNPTDVTLLVVALVPGDCDEDGDIDQNDNVAIVNCLSGPLGNAAPGCSCVDIDQDGDADLADWAQFQAVFTAP